MTNLGWSFAFYTGLLKSKVLMKSQVKPLLSKMTRRELVRLCNEKLVCAARDLAEFTKNGINASFIVAVAHKCEHFEDTLEQTPISLYPQQDPQQTEQEIQEAVWRICELGQQIWSSSHPKYQDYVIHVQAMGSSQSGAANVA